jgi:hypothetical protein
MIVYHYTFLLNDSFNTEQQKTVNNIFKLIEYQLHVSLIFNYYKINSKL